MTLQAHLWKSVCKLLRGRGYGLPTTIYSPLLPHWPHSSVSQDHKIPNLNKKTWSDQLPHSMRWPWDSSATKMEAGMLDGISEAWSLGSFLLFPGTGAQYWGRAATLHWGTKYEMDMTWLATSMPCAGNDRKDDRSLGCRLHQEPPLPGQWSPDS